MQETSELRQHVKNINFVTAAVSAIIVLSITRYTTPWIMDSGNFYFALAPIAILLAIVFGLSVIAGAVNFDSSGILTLYCAALTYVIYIGADAFNIIPSDTLFEIIVAGVIFIASMFIIRWILTIKRLTHGIECLVVTGLTLALVREIALYVISLWPF